MNHETHLKDTSRMWIYRQNPRMKNLGLKQVLIASNVRNGPEDDMVAVFLSESQKVEKDENGDFRVEWKGKASMPQKDKILLQIGAIHAFAVCRMVLTMYQRAFNRLGQLRDSNGEFYRIVDPDDVSKKTGLFDFTRKWGNTRLQLRPKVYPGQLRADYSNGGSKIISFGYKGDIYTCHSFDTVAHETGHAVLDAIWLDHKKSKPSIYRAILNHLTNEYATKVCSVPHSQQRTALNEAFCDLTILFTILSQLEMCELVIIQTKGDLEIESFLTAIAEYLVQNQQHQSALRDLLDKVILNKEDANDSHRLSLAFSGAVYRFMVTVFEDHLNLHKFDPAETLFRVARFVAATTLAAFYLVRDEGKITFFKVGFYMIRCIRMMEKDDMIGDQKERTQWANILQDIFSEFKFFPQGLDMRNDVL